MRIAYRSPYEHLASVCVGLGDDVSDEWGCKWAYSYQGWTVIQADQLAIINDKLTRQRRWELDAPFAQHLAAKAAKRARRSGKPPHRLHST